MEKVDLKVFGKRLKELRQAHGTTQLSLAKSIGYSVSSIRNWEHGVCIINVEVACKLAKFFNISTMKLLGLDD